MPFYAAIGFLAELQIQMFAFYHSKFRIYHAAFFYDNPVISLSIVCFGCDFCSTGLYGVNDSIAGNGSDGWVHTFIGDHVFFGYLFCLTEEQRDCFSFCLCLAG